jgi:retron-type reverse transcriptase
VDRAKPFDIPKREVWEAYKRVKANQGAAGVDGESIESFEADLSNTLYKLWNRCRRAVIIRHRFVGLIYRKGTDEERGHWKVRCSKPPGRVLGSTCCRR